MVFMGRGFTSGGQESGSVFNAAVCKILVLKDKRSCFSRDEMFTVQLPLDRVLALVGHLIHIWKPSIESIQH